jgi:WD40 repeat protein
VATGSDEHGARVWSADGQLAAKLTAGPMKPASPIALSPDGTRLAVANAGSHTVSVWDTKTWVRTCIGSRSTRATAIALNPSGTMIVSGGLGGDISIHGLDGAVLRHSTPHIGPVHGVACSPNHGVFASAGEDGTIRLVGLVTGEEVQCLLEHTGPVRALAFSPDGTCLVSVGADKLVHVWRTK